MLVHRSPRRPDGFTIVETMIVLALAGFILFLVLGAIPALQRSSRNNQRRQDVQNILQIISHYELNNSGNVPSQAVLRSLLNPRDRLTYYQPTDVTLTLPGLTPNLITTPNAATINNVLIRNRAKCEGTGGTASNRGAGYSDIVAQYRIETLGGTEAQCQQL